MSDKVYIKYFRIIAREEYFPLYLLMISAFVLFYRLSGSIVGWDEGIYSQIAREGLLSNNWIDLYYRGHLWFEKPPLIIWLTMISYGIFGINEFAVWFFPATFGIIGILGTYYLAKDLFNPKIALLSSLILLSIPHYVLMSRNNMTDIFLLANSLLSFVFLIRSKENGRYFILSGIFFGLAFLSKNFISFLILPVFALYLFIDGRPNVFKDKYFYLFILSFLVVSLPWHLIMFLKYKWSFVDEYIGYHLIERYRHNILNSVQSSDILHYAKVIVLRSGSWWFAFLAAMPVIFFDIKNKVNRKKLLLLLFWFMLIISFFSSSVTKLHHYILILYVPFSILTAYALYNSYRRRSVFILLFLFVLLMNVNPPIEVWVSDFGESKLLAAFIMYNVFNFSTPAANIVIVLAIGLISYQCLFKNRTFAPAISLLAIFTFSFVLPFNPDRSPLAKRIGEMALKDGVKNIYYYNYTEQTDNVEGSLVFYSYPIPIKALRQANMMSYSEGSSSYCLIYKSDYSLTKKLDYEYYPCEVKSENGG